VTVAPIHIHPTAPLAPRALLPGDPGRALALAQALLEQPKMFNHNRGLWGYTGAALADGEPLTIQSTGMGGPSAAIVLEELCDLGLRMAVRVGTCGALDAGLALGDLVAAEAALAADGTSRALGAGERIGSDAALAASLAGGGARAGLVVSTDVFYERDESRARAWRAAGALAVEMEAATIFAVAAQRGIRAGCVLAVSDLLAGDGRQHARLDAEGLTAAGLRLGHAAVAALQS
jgi:DeoD family purine-nucleoside phosphorylase